MKKKKKKKMSVMICWCFVVCSLTCQRVGIPPESHKML